MGRRTPINWDENRLGEMKHGESVKSTHFRNTFVADVTLAAYVNASTRYKVMGRLNVGSAVSPQISSSRQSLQAGHKAKAVYPSANDGHDPVDLSSSGPSVPAVKIVNASQIYETYGRTEDQRG
jgi:hypothetical protein